MSFARRSPPDSGVQLRLLPEPTAPVYPEPTSQLDRLAQAFALAVMAFTVKGGRFLSPVAVTRSHHEGYVILSSAECASHLPQKTWEDAAVRWMKVEIARRAGEPCEWFGVGHG